MTVQAEKTAGRLAVVLPVLNEIGQIEARLQGFAALRDAGAELIFVDGGSTDGSARRLREHHFKVLNCRPGRAAQMNLGAAQAGHSVLLFLHIDSQLPRDFSAGDVCEQLAASGRAWGFFRVRLSRDDGIFALIARGINWRSRVFRVATGDQGIFICSETFKKIGGYQDIPLMEDIELARRLKKISPPLILPGCITTSARRWEKRGALRTTVLMWSLQLAFKLGVSPRRLHRWYYS